MRLTVVLTSYNYARYLPQALEALAGQRRLPDELLVIDDSSEDESVAIISAFLDRFPNARLLRNSVRLGTVANLNRGLSLASGDVVYFAAADDVTYPALLGLGTQLLEAYPQAALFSAKSDIIDLSGRREGVIATAQPLLQSGFIPPATIRRMLLRDDSWLTGNTTLYRRAALADAGGFANELGSFCDGYVSRLLAARHGACFSPEVLGAWRRHSGGFAWSQTASFSESQQIVAAVVTRMEAESVFPPGYAQRWAGRYLFGARRFGLIRARNEAYTRSRVAGLVARVREMAVTAWLFSAYRPWDWLAVARRRIPVIRLLASKAAP